MKPRIILRSLTFSDSKTYPIPENGIVVFVGPNNSGKSRSLHDIFSIIHGASNTQVIKNIEIEKIGTLQQFLDALKPVALPSDGQRFSSLGFNFHVHQLSEFWNASSPFLGSVGGYFVQMLNTSSRLADCNPPSSINILDDVPQHPIHVLFKNDDLEKSISKYFVRAFGKELVVHRGAGNSIPLFVGKRPEIQSGEDRVSSTYLAKIQQLDRLQEQGDGFKSFASLILRIKTADRGILLVDEPEAFLHPPQARQIGEIIATEQPDKSQIFIATHSNDVLQGLLNAAPSRVTVIRLVREKNINHTSFLENAKVIDLWKDPILRYSNILSGLFHEGTVVTESDGDCRFYESVAACRYATMERQPDIFFTYSGGKHRIPVVLEALHALNVPVKAIVDFDIFNNDKPLEPIFSALGGDWSQIEDDWKKVKHAIEEKKPWLLGKPFKEKVLVLLAKVSDDKAVPDQVISGIKKILSEASPWDAVKQAGLAVVPAGDATRRFKSLITELEKIGCFVTPNGEMEGFCKSIGGHGPKWVEAALQKDICNDSELVSAREFISRLVNSF